MLGAGPMRELMEQYGVVRLGRRAPRRTREPFGLRHPDQVAITAVARRVEAVLHLRTACGNERLGDIELIEAVRHNVRVNRFVAVDLRRVEHPGWLRIVAVLDVV